MIREKDKIGFQTCELIRSKPGVTESDEVRNETIREQLYQPIFGRIEDLNYSGVDV